MSVSATPGASKYVPTDIPVLLIMLLMLPTLAITLPLGVIAHCLCSGVRRGWLWARVIVD